MLSVGIIGLPNVGKSTLFNALTATGAEVSNYPFTTLEANVGVVAVPDPRLAALGRRLGIAGGTPCFVRFVDVAGLVAGASRGEGLGNQFLGEIRGVDAVAHVVRCFPDLGVAHVHGSVDPVRDAGVIGTELLLADLEVLERAIAKRERVWATAPREHAAERERLTAWRRSLAEGLPLAALGLGEDERRDAKALGMITAKPMLHVANVGEDGYGEAAGTDSSDTDSSDTDPGDTDPSDTDAAGAAAGGGALAALRAHLARRSADGKCDRSSAAGVVALSARLEAELAELPPAERQPFLDDLGLAHSGLERLAEAAFALLDLVRFYTVVGGKLHAWEVPRGTLAPQGAGRVHSDMEQGFIRARVAPWDELVEAGGFPELMRQGRVRTEGKGYPVADGDVIEFLFND